MHALVVNKNMDYSVQILYLSSSAKAMADKSPSAVIKSPAIIKQPTSAPQKKTVVQAPVQKNNPTKTTTTKKTESPAPTPPQKIAATTTMFEEKKTEPIKQEKKDDIQAELPQKAEPKPEIKKVEARVEKAVPAEIPQPIAAQTTEPQKTDIPPTASAPHVPENAHVSNNFREVEALRRGAQLQKELVQKWQPPIGVSSDCCCDISFSVSKKGIVQQLKMIKSSGVLMFDISARQALFAMKMPQWTYGKPLIISFKQ
jgi:hypothetical protein